MNREDMTILLVEDNPADARLVREALRDAHADHVELEHVERLDLGLQRLAAGGIDVVLLDLSLPDASGLDTLTGTLAAAPQVPIVVVTGLSDEALAVQAVRAGAQDYLVKGQLDGAALVRCMQYAIERNRMLGELEQVRRQQLELKDRLLSHVSHELRTPLNAVYGFVTILLDGLAGDVSPKQRECLDIALTNVNQLRTMIGDLLDATRAESGKIVVDPGRTAVAELIVETVDTLRATAIAKGVILSTDVPEDLPAAYADPRRVRQILNNLVDNGIKFTSASETVTIRAELFDQAPDFLRITVADHGCGISAEGKEKIFERFHQEARTGEDGRKGLGLGLYISKALVARQGGRLWVESEPGRGSAFSFTLPVFSEARARGGSRTVPAERLSSPR